MKKIFLVFSVLVYCNNAYCAPGDLFIYGEAGGGWGIYNGIKFGLNSIINSNVFSVGYNMQYRAASGVPEDYRSDVFSIPGGKPMQTLSMLTLTYGKPIYTSVEQVRFLIKGGLALGNIAKPVNFTTDSMPGPVHHYRYNYDKQFACGLYVNPTIEFPLTSKFGFSLGVWGNLNNVSSSAGIETTMMFGKIRNKTRVTRRAVDQ